MKYLKCFNEILDEEYKNHVIKAKGRKKDSKHIEWLVIQECIQNPSFKKEQLYEHMKQEKSDLSYADFLKALDGVNLNTESKRKYINEKLRLAGKDFCNFLKGDKRAAGYITKYMNNLVERDKEDRRMYFNAKYLLVYLYNNVEELRSPKLEMMLETYLEGYCTTMLNKVYKKVCVEMNYTYKRSTKDVIDKTKKALEINTTECDVDETQDKDTQLERLKFQVDNYKNTLELVQTLFDELRESVEDSAKEAQSSAISDFFTTLNSNEFGNILDNLGVVEKSFEEMRLNQITIPKELMPLVIIFKQITRFIKSFGIEQIETMNRTFEASYEDIAYVNYIGEPYQNENDTKQVIVSAPGWRYKETIISLPTLREI